MASSAAIIARGTTPFDIKGAVQTRNRGDLSRSQAGLTQTRNALADIALQRAPKLNQRADEAHERNMFIQTAQDFVSAFEGGGWSAADAVMGNMPDTGKLGESKARYFAARKTPGEIDENEILQAAKGVAAGGQQDQGANAQFGNSRPVVATTASGRKLNGVVSDVRDPETQQVTTKFIPDVPGSWDATSDPIATTSNVGRMGITGEEQNEATRLRGLQLEREKTEQQRIRGEQTAKTERLTGFADTGLTAAQAHTTTKRSLDLLGEIKTGGWEGVQLRAEQLFGIQSGNEAELTTGMLRVVLAQLKPVFGAAFTKAEGDSLKAIEANIGKSTEGNIQLLEQLLKIQNRAARRGISAANEINDKFTANEIQAELDFNLSTETPEGQPAQSSADLPEGAFIRLQSGQRQQVVNGELVNVDG